MEPTQHITNNRVLGAPAGWNEPDGATCRALAITDTEMDVAPGVAIPAVASFWRPDALELKALQEGGLVVLHIAGSTHPPLWIGVTPA